MDSQRNPSRPANSSPTSSAADEAQTTPSTTPTPATLLPLRSAVPALTLLAVGFAAGDFGPIEAGILAYGSGAH